MYISLFSFLSPLLYFYTNIKNFLLKLFSINRNENKTVFGVMKIFKKFVILVIILKLLWMLIQLCFYLLINFIFLPSVYERGLTVFCRFVKIRVFVGISVFTKVLACRTFVHFMTFFEKILPNFTQLLRLLKLVCYSLSMQNSCKKFCIP